MPDYSKGQIYTIRCYDDKSLIYVGSTIQPLSKRFNHHKKDNNCSLYQYINKNYNGIWNNWYIELYEEFKCDNKEQLNKREGEIQREIATINKRIEGRTKKEYYLENVDKIKENIKEYYLENADKIKENKKEYYLENVEKIKERKRLYYLRKKEEKSTE